MTNNEMLEKVIKETFPDIFENNSSLKVRTDFCSIICCEGTSCDKCCLYGDLMIIPYGSRIYKGSNSNNLSNSTTAITSGEISW